MSAAKRKTAFGAIRVRRSVKILLRVFGGTAALLLLAQTPLFRSFLAAGLSRFLARRLDHPVSISPVGGWLPFSFSLEEASVGDEEDPWLRLEGLEMSWSPVRLFGGRLQIDRFRLRSLHYSPPPEKDPPARGGRGSVALPSFIYRLRVAYFRVESFRPAVREGAGGPELRLEGSLADSPRLDRSTLTLRGGIAAGDHARPAEVSVRAELSRGADEGERLILRSAAGGLDELLPAPSGLLAPVARFELRARTAPPGRLEFEEFALSSPVFRLAASGTADLEREEVDFSGRADFSDLAPLGIFGTARARFRVSGSPALPLLRLQAESEEVSIAGFRLDGLSSELEAVPRPEEVRLSLQSGFSHRELPFRLASRAILREGALTVDPLELSGPGLGLSGNLRFAPGEETPGIELTAFADDLALLETVTGLSPWAGEARASLSLVPVPEGGRLAADLTADSLATPWAAVGALNAQARTGDPLPLPRGFLEIAFDDGRVPGIHLGDGMIRLLGAPDSAFFQGEISGYREEPVQLEFSGYHFLRRRDLRLFLRGLNFEMGDWKTSLAAPSSLRVAPGRFEIEELALAWEGGGFIAAGSLKEEESRLAATVERLPLALPFLFPGAGPEAGLNLELELRGRADSPEGELGLELFGLEKVPGGAAAPVPELGLTLNARLEEERLSGLLSGVVSEERPLAASFDLPLQVALLPARFQPDPRREFRVHIAGGIGLAPVAAALLPEYLSLEGELEADLEASGTLDSLRLNGYLQLADGAFEDPELGLVIRSLEALITGRESELAVTASAGDGGEGRLGVEGGVDLAHLGEFPFRFGVNLSDFRVPRHDLFTAVSRGDIRWEGDRSASKLSGSLRVSSAEIRIPDRLPVHITELEVEEVGLPRPPPPPPPGPPPHQIEFDLRVRIPARLFVRGQGLDSEWEGELRVEGNASEPRVFGQLNVVRGRYVFFGRRLVLSRGSLFLDGRWPVSPVISAEAETVTAGITARLAVAGEADSLAFNISSDPPLPEDEILSRLLFGREVARMSPLQAVTFAQALHALATGRPAADITAFGRRLLGVDVLEIRDREEEPGSTAVSVGKYIGDRVFVEYEQGVADDYGRLVIKIEIFPGFHLETSTSTETGSGMGFSWSWDY